MFKAVIFDMDGVIVDSEHIFHEVNNNIYNEIGAKISDEEYNSFVGKSSKEIWSYIKNKFKLQHNVEKLINMEFDGFIEYFSKIKNPEPINGIYNLITDLNKHNYKIGLASSSIMRCIITVLNKLKLEKYFEAVVSGENVKNGKPAPDIFLYAAELLNVNPEHCLVIEDSFNGVKSAKSAGMKCLGYINKNSGYQDLSQADFITDSFTTTNFNKILDVFK